MSNDWITLHRSDLDRLASDLWEAANEEALVEVSGGVPRGYLLPLDAQQWITNWLSHESKFKETQAVTSSLASVKYLRCQNCGRGISILDMKDDGLCQECK